MNGDDVPIGATIIGMLQLAQWITQQVERHQRGDLTDDELVQLSVNMKVKVDAANNLWEST